MRCPAFCVGCCSVLPAVLCCPFALPGLLRQAAVLRQAGCPALPGWLLPDGVLQQRPSQQQLCHGVHSQQHLPDGSSLQRPCQPLRRSAPASNKPHPAEKSTPVWLAIWRTWAGFANSQLLHAAFCSIYLYRCAHSPSYHIELLLRQTQICRPICTDCLRHLRISAE